MKSLIALIALLLTATLATPALAANSAAASGYVCQLYGKYRDPAASAITTEALQVNPITKQPVTCPLQNDPTLLGYRIQPYVPGTFSNNPIIKVEENYPQPGKTYDACWYVANDSTHPYFVPAKTARDFDAFVSTANRRWLAGDRSMGIHFQPCVQPVKVSDELLCKQPASDEQAAQPAGTMVAAGNKWTSTNNTNATSLAPADGQVRNYNVFDASGKLLRTLATMPTTNGWIVQPTSVCANADTAGTKTAGFDRNASPSTTVASAPAKTSTISAASLNALDTASGPVATKTVAATPVTVATPASTTTTTTPVATPASFNAETGSTTRVFITDGALARHIQ